MDDVTYQTPADAAIAGLLARSNRLGSDPRNTNYAGGNASAKGFATDPVTSEPTELMWVKGSGGDLGTLTAAGLAVLRLDRLPGHRVCPGPLGRGVAAGVVGVARVGPKPVAARDQLGDLLRDHRCPPYLT